MTSDDSKSTIWSLIFAQVLVLNKLKAEKNYQLIVSEVDTILEHSSFVLDSADAVSLTGVATIASFGFDAAMNLADYAAALRHAEMEVAFGQRIGPDDFSLARGLSNRGLAKHELGQFIGAENDYLAALDIVEKNASPFTDTLKQLILSHLGQLQLTRGEMEQAQKNLLASSAPHQPPLMNIPEALLSITALVNQGLIAFEGKHFDGAEQFYRQAFAIAESEHAGSHVQGIIASNLGMVFQGQGRMSLAIEYLEKACRYHKDFPPSPGPLAMDLNNLGQLYEQLGDREKAVRCFKEAWDVIRALTPHSLIALIILRHLGMHRLHQGDFKRARAALMKGMELYEEMRPRIAYTEEGQEGIFKTYRGLVEMMMYLSLQETWHDELLLLTERAKARFWREQIDYLEDQKMGSLEKEGAFETDRSGSRKDQISVKSVPSSGEAIKNTGTEPDRVSSSHEIQLLSGNNGLLLNFFVGPNATFLSYVFNKTVGNYRIDVTEDELFALVQAFINDLMGSSRRAQYSNNGKKLSELLLDKMELATLDIRHIMIMPDGPLWYLPFDALPLPQHMNAQGAYLCDIGPISYAPSATILDEFSRREHRIQEHEDWRFLVVVQPALSSAFSPIKGTSEESFELGRIMGTTHMTVLKEGSATKAKFLASLGQVTHIHIGSHALADLKNAAPCIVFTGSAEKDDFLYTYEIIHQRIDTDLVFLSACSTSIGKNSTGEGLMSIARAFLLAGCRCVIATLWPVNDHEVPFLVTQFYRNLSSGITVAAALRLARLEFKKRGGSARTWAAFQVIGSGDSLSDRYSTRYLQL